MGFTALSTASTKVAGAAGLLWVLWAMWCWAAWRGTQRPDFLPTALASAAKWWWWACLLALAFKAIPQVIWNDPWGERHFLIRTTLLAGATMWLLPWMLTWRPNRQHVLAAVSVAGAVSLWVAIRHLMGHETPTNRINWAVSLGFLACLPVPWTRAPLLAAPWRWLAGLGTLCLLMAVLFSGVRGAYPVVLWCGLVWLATGRTPGRPTVPLANSRWRRWGLTALLLGALVASVVTLYPQSWSVPAQRLQLATQEAQRFWAQADGQGAKSSVGVRLYLWQQSIPAIADAPLLGHGREGRMALLHQWGENIGWPEMSTLGHLHNEYIHAMIDHGVLGLLSLLCQMGGLLLVAWELRREQPRAAWGMAGVAFMHIVASLSNVNTAHNYYGAMLGWSVTLGMLLAASAAPMQKGATLIDK